MSSPRSAPLLSGPIAVGNHSGPRSPDTQGRPFSRRNPGQICSIGALRPINSANGRLDWPRRISQFSPAKQNELGIFRQWLETRLTPNLGDKSGYDRAAHDGSQKDGVLNMIDSMVGQIEHAEIDPKVKPVDIINVMVQSFTRFEFEIPRRRQDTDKLCCHRYRGEKAKDAVPAISARASIKRTGVEKIERCREREADGPYAYLELLLPREERRERHPDKIRRQYGLAFFPAWLDDLGRTTLETET